MLGEVTLGPSTRGSMMRLVWPENLVYVGIFTLERSVISVVGAMIWWWTCIQRCVKIRDTHKWPKYQTKQDVEWTYFPSRQHLNIYAAAACVRRLLRHCAYRVELSCRATIEKSTAAHILCESHSALQAEGANVGIIRDGEPIVSPVSDTHSLTISRIRQ